MKKLFFGYLLSAIFINCKMNRITYSMLHYKKAESFIMVESFPSTDTATIIFYKNKIWFKVFVPKNRYSEVSLPQKCELCDSTFSSEFFRMLLSIKEEDRQSRDCTIYRDTIINKINVQGITNFYDISDLREESIILKYGGKRKTISFLEPRFGIKYCRENTDRVKFIKFSDELRALQ